jgi:hypothetical protein
VLQLRNEYYLTYYCKNNICFEYHSTEKLIKIPNENGTSELIITDNYSQNSEADLKEAYDCYKDVW